MRLHYFDYNTAVHTEVRISVLGSLSVRQSTTVGAVMFTTVIEMHLCAQANQIGKLADRAQVLVLSITTQGWAAECC